MGYAGQARAAGRGQYDQLGSVPTVRPGPVPTGWAQYQPAACDWAHAPHGVP